VESFAGNAIQIKVIETLFQDKTFEEKNPQILFIFLHTLNPYGASFSRRVNENNVDLNRNFFYEEMKDQIEPTKKQNSYEERSGNLRYSYLNDLLNPNYDDIGYFDNVSFYFNGVYKFFSYGYQNFKQSVFEGQYSFPKGLFFGGAKVEQGPRLICKFLVEKFAEAECYFHIDVHTGLGNWAHDMLILDPNKRTMDNGFVEALGDHKVDTFGYSADGSFPRGVDRLFNSDPNAPNFHNWLGPLDDPDPLQRRLNSTKAFGGVTQEFGTYSGIAVFDSLRIENFYHHRHHASNPNQPHFVESKKAVLDTFNPSDVGWRTTVLERGDWLLRRVLAHACTKSSSSS